MAGALGDPVRASPTNNVDCKEDIFPAIFRGAFLNHKLLWGQRLGGFVI